MSNRCRSEGLCYLGWCVWFVFVCISLKCNLLKIKLPTYIPTSWNTSGRTLKSSPTVIKGHIKLRTTETWIPLTKGPVMWKVLPFHHDIDMHLPFFLPFSRSCLIVWHGDNYMVMARPGYEVKESFAKIWGWSRQHPIKLGHVSRKHWEFHWRGQWCSLTIISSLMTPHGDIDLSEYWHRCWLVA